MNLTLLGISLVALTALAPVFGLVVYLTPRQIPHRIVWSVALVIGVGVTAATTTVMDHALQGIVPSVRLLTAYVALYLVPIVVLTLAASVLRTRLRSRALGSIVLLILFVCVMFVPHYTWDPPFDIVNASS